MDSKYKIINFTVNEQNCLAMMCSIMSGVSYKVKTEQPLIKIEDELYDLVDRFPSINWGLLYDKFHRQGANL
jgi:hypothetical protein